LKKNRLSLGIIILAEVIILAVFFIYTAINKDRDTDAAGLSETIAEAKDEAEPSDAKAETKGESGPSDAKAEAESESEPSDTKAEAKGESELSDAKAEAESESGPSVNPSEAKGKAETQDDLNETRQNSTGEISYAGEGDEGPVPKDVYDTITISAAGDVTLGRDKNYGYERSFDHEYEKQGKDFSYFFSNVRHIFEADDLTIVNLETTLTNADKPAEKKFRFRADPSYVEILKQGNIEAVSIANNHTLDYLQKGYDDTISTLKEANVAYFGYEHSYIADIRGIKIGIIGYVCWNAGKDMKKTVADGIEGLKNEGADLVIVMFHWGIENDYYPDAVQKTMARFAIDNGADLVLGAHPHVLQGIEEYNGKSIVYSLGNFCFGGNKNPKDKDTMIYIHRFNFKNGELESQEHEVIPCSVSSVKNRNNYRPTPLEGSEAERVLNKIKKYSDF
jgi:poly-gamma-glutamate capsule biosynthesis protein CapA/YwtB (metallophosphatase superfamily)/F0F1-type ATP synthase membrane subunit b/b'